MTKVENLNHYYQIHVNHLLSTRLDTDISKEFFDKVVFHGTAYNSLQTIIDSFASSGQSTFTLTGSYGTGKSTLAAVLTGLLHQDDNIRSAARNLVNDKRLLKKLDNSFKLYDEKPWLIVKAVGGVTSPAELFYKSILKALEEAKLIEFLQDDLFFLFEEIKTEQQLIAWIDQVFRALDGKISGSIFILDEMGKLLDHIARNSGDLHLFQELSEKINRLSTKECPFLFLGVLHQAFSDYAKGLSHQIALEWAKIQGRYVDIAYRISLDESVALVSKTIKKTKNKIPNPVVILNERLIDDAMLSISSRLIESSPKIKQYFINALPLHPLTTILLGAIAKSSFSQNERSIFSFLLSVEPLSFRKFLEADVEYYKTYTIVDLWDYLSHNLQHQILGSKEGHSWSVVEESLTLLSKQMNKLEINKNINLDQLYFNIVKAVAMMNLFGKPLGVYPTKKLIANALPTSAASLDFLDECLNNLQSWGVITYWNRTDSYEVVETSELNIQQLLEEKLQTLSTQQSYFEHIDYKGNSILAKRHYQQKGVIRWMDQHLVSDISGLKSLIDSDTLENRKAFAHFVLITGQALNSKQLAEISSQHPNILISQLKKLSEILNWSKEIFALKEIYRDQPKLMIDPVAKKEYEQRLNYAYQQVDSLFQQSFEHVDWYFSGEKILSKSLSMVASEIADKIFFACPTVSNELVVRHDVSSSAAAGRRKLLEKMLESNEFENLNIEKFPPEKAIYLSCLKQLGLHQYQAGENKWAFVIPKYDIENNPHTKVNLKLVTEMMEVGHALFKSNKSLVKIADLYDIWAKPPFGIPQGLLPIFGLALLLAKEKALAFYDQDITQDFRFISSMDEEFVNKLVKRPNEIAVKFVKEPEEKDRFIQLVAQSISSNFSIDIDETPLLAARFIVSYVVKQSNWVKFSKDVDFFEEKVQQLRAFIVKADDPYKLLFEDMYDLLDVNKRSDVQIRSDLSDFFISIQNAKANLFKKFEQCLFKELGDITFDILEQAKSVSRSAADWKMKKFAEHLSNSSNDSSQWISNMITLLGQIPERDWSDDSLKKAFEALPSYVQRFKQLSFFAKKTKIASDEDHKSLAIIVNTVNGLEEYNRNVIIEPELQTKLNSVEIELSKQVNLIELSDDAKAIVLYQLLRNYLYPIGKEGKHEG
ncbi:P-loop NTPase fold protein [Acinetobacter sp. 3657]|uniref:P-loop NTPase fold protein n=1 Tax=Acinetobacter sp. 3657 TaxID=2817764 RepID=UPI002863ED48|nr:energy-coupling factor transporter ATP-binding protein EcfA2 [Prolinoborus sp. 3657]